MDPSPQMTLARLYSHLQDVLLGQEVAYPEVAIPIETLRELYDVCLYPQHGGVPHGRRTDFALSCQNFQSFHHLFRLSFEQRSSAVQHCKYPQHAMTRQILREAFGHMTASKVVSHTSSSVRVLSVVSYSDMIEQKT